MYYKNITLIGPPAAIGYEDENLPTRVIIDISDLTKYGTGTTVLEVKRPCDKEAYIAEQTEVDGNNFYWYPTKGDLGASGLLKCQVKAVIGDQIVKTRVYLVQVSGALNGDGTLSGVVPDALQTFMESTSRSEDAAKASAEEAKKAEEAAKASETAAKKSEADAKASEAAAKASETAAAKSASDADASAQAAATAGNAVREQVSELKGDLYNSLELSIFPEVVDKAGIFTHTSFGSSVYFCTSKKIMAGETVSKFICNATSDQNPSAYFFLINMYDKILYCKQINLSEGKNEVNINYTVKEDAYFGIQNLVARYTFVDKTSKFYNDNRDYLQDKIYSIGLKECEVEYDSDNNEVYTPSHTVGDTIITHDLMGPNYIFVFNCSITTTCITGLSEIYSRLNALETKSEEVVLPKIIQLSYNDISDPIGYSGRWWDETINGTKYKMTNNDGAQIFFRVSGKSSITPIWYKKGFSSNLYYSYSIDGGKFNRLLSTQAIPLPDNGEHIVRIVVDGVTEGIGKWNGNGIGFGGVGVATTGLYPRNKIIHYYGDSITEGISAGAGGTDNNDMGNTNMATGAYPWFVSYYTNTNPYFVGYGATGIKSTGSFNTLYNAINYLYNSKIIPPLDKEEPDLICINHGTNDGSVSSSDFITETNKALDKFNIIYPGVKIVYIVPFNQSHASDIAKCVNGRNNCYYCETASFKSEITFADGIHPLTQGADIAGKHIAEFIIKNNLI